MTQAVTRPPESVPAVYRAHPLLDPFLPSRQPSLARLWIATWRALERDPEGHEAMVRVYAAPLGAQGAPPRRLEHYFRDADHYLDDLLRLVPAPVREALQPLPATRECRELDRLVRTTFQGPDIRSRYEAQRKLYLAKLLFDIDHCRSVRDGLRHKEQFEALLSRTLWAGARDGEEVEVCCRHRWESGREQFEVGVAPGPEVRCWTFRLRRLPETPGERPVDIYLYRSRFKRETEPPTDVPVSGGRVRLEEAPRWPGLGRRSGSILSKMLRRGIGDPRMVQDLLGAMFIVGDRRQAYALERRLVRQLGGPLRWRDRVDTLAGERDRDRLDLRSHSGFRVLKQILDVLMEDPGGESPYLFPVEVQIYPVEDYLRTLHDSHFASHAAYKRRQFLHDLLPMLFPPAVFGGYR